MSDPTTPAGPLPVPVMPEPDASGPATPAAPQLPLADGSTPPPPDLTQTYEPPPWTAKREAQTMQTSLTIQADEAIARRTALGQTFDDWQAYRDALDAVPQQAGYPLHIGWPLPPSP
ncbi:phage tail assembly chaperone [Paraburkholderia sp. MM5384-R2]|uniref:phage tail assembly chaperone n=1 Tax=Paraburkholderia sp. MM5384-R2 TaxID=2723097 RepID=UPI0016142CC5|nr:phage tail assembly chaperone [Paraburkholderia sp. MM5384-R2]MBB5496883.1 hypothetical protein [Paraburkholderia sp. MM5384-R2]